MKYIFSFLFISIGLVSSCDKPDSQNPSEIQGFELLNDINGHWVGTNQTSFGFFDWFAFDFRPISSSHSHSIYEGATNQNIINSIFVAEINGEQRIFARNGGWLRAQYRATYFVLDIAEEEQEEKFYRLVDAVGGEDRAFIEFRFRQDSIFFDAYKDDSGSLDKPKLHMSFKGANRNSDYSRDAREHFNYPLQESEVNFGNGFDNLVDPDSALFLDEESDPFPKEEHGYLSDVKVDLIRNAESENEKLFLYFSKDELVSSTGLTNKQNIDNSVIRTIVIQSVENSYTATYLHPDDYFFTLFLDRDGNGFPSTGDISSVSKIKTINPEMIQNLSLELLITIQ